MIEKAYIQKRFTKAFSSYDEHAFAQQQINRHLLDMLRFVPSLSFRKILEIGCGSGGFTKLLAGDCQADDWFLNDLCPIGETNIAEILKDCHWHFLPGDAEKIVFPDKLDCVASASTFQWFVNPCDMIRRIGEHMVEGGIFLFNTFGPDNLREIKQLTGKGLVYPDEKEIQRWLAPSFEISYLYKTEIVLPFDSPQNVLRHLKYTGVTATNDVGWTRGHLQQFCTAYTQLYARGEYVLLTYQPIYVLAIKK